MTFKYTYFLHRRGVKYLIKNLSKQFIREEKGAPIVEIVILIAISAIIAAFLFPTLRTALASWFNDMIGNISKGIGGSSGGVKNEGVNGVSNNNGAWGTN